MSDMKILHLWLRCPRCREKIEINQEVGEAGLWSFTLSCLKCKVAILTLENWTGRMGDDCTVHATYIRKIIIHTVFHRMGIIESFNKPGLYYKELEDGTMAFIDFRDKRYGKYEIYAFKDGSRANVPDFKTEVDNGIDWLWFDPMKKAKANRAELEAMEFMRQAFERKQHKEGGKDER